MRKVLCHLHQGESPNHVDNAFRADCVPKRVYRRLSGRGKRRSLLEMPPLAPLVEPKPQPVERNGCGWPKRPRD